MGAGHSHGPSSGANEKRLWIVLGLTGAFLIAELIAAYVTRSLALLSDAAHMFTDVAALAVSLFAIRIGRRAADRKRTFGYQRFEILAAAYNARVLFLVALYILYEAVERLRDPIAIPTTAMLVVAVLGLVVNLIGMRLLRSGSEHSLNMKGAYLEVWSDMLGSIGVIAAALLMKWTGYVWLDSVVAVGIGLWVLPRTWTLLKESVNVLLQGVPTNIDLGKIEAGIAGVSGVKAIHDLHVWSLTAGKDVLSAHVVIDVSQKSEQQLLNEIDAVIRGQGIHHSTVQIESETCPTAHHGTKIDRLQ
jgi:cobalt-zinc-cadmium efflux system protein